MPGTDYTDYTDREIIERIVRCGRSHPVTPLLVRFLFCDRYGPMIVRKSQSSAFPGVVAEDMPAEMAVYFCSRVKKDSRCYPRLHVFLDSKWESFEGYLATTTFQRLLEIAG